MKMTLSNGASGFAPNSMSRYFARPSRKGLYGKKPVAKMASAMGMSTLLSASAAIPSDHFITRLHANKTKRDIGDTVTFCWSRSLPSYGHRMWKEAKARGRFYQDICNNSRKFSVLRHGRQEAVTTRDLKRHVQCKIQS